MTDLTPVFAGILQKHGKQLRPRTFSVDNLDDFLKEAYKINEHIVSLHRDLRSIRQSYLSTAQPRRTQLRAGLQHQQHNDSGGGGSATARPLSDRDREKVDADAKQMLRKLNASIKGLRETEQVRHETEIALISQKYGGGRGFSLAKNWVAGGVAGLAGANNSKSGEQEAAEDREKAVSTHRGSVLWMLGQRLQACIATQQEMMEIRISREMEKNRSVLAKARAPPDMAALRAMMEPGDGSGGATAEMGRKADEEAQKSGAAYNPTADLTEEQIQMFQQDNADMLRHYESTLDQVRTAQKSLIEISELQTQLVDNLTTQSANIDLLMADSSNTTENVGGGNKQLKQATQRPSTAKYTFYATCGLCAFLVAWDLVI